MIASHDLQQQMRDAREAVHDDFAGMLTSEQRERFELVNEFQKTCRGSGDGQGFGRHGGGRGGFGGPPGS